MVTLESVLSVADQESKLDKSIWHSLKRNGDVEADEAIVKGLIERHFKHTGSTRARNLLDDWTNARSKFVKVFPSEYKRALGEMHAAKTVKAKEKALA
jgi:glutamate synthase (NADPH/NADH) large chain